MAWTASASRNTTGPILTAPVELTVFVPLNLNFSVEASNPTCRSCRRVKGVGRPQKLPGIHTPYRNLCLGYNACRETLETVTTALVYDDASL